MSETQEWQVYEYQDGYWLVAERRDQPERGWIFKYEMDAIRLQRRLTDTEQRLADIKAERNELRQSYDRRARNFDSELNDLKAKLAKANRHLGMLLRVDEPDVLIESSIIALEREIATNAGLKAKLAETEQRLARMTDACEEVTDLLSSTSAKLADAHRSYQTSIAGLHDERDRLQAKLAEAERERERLVGQQQLNKARIALLAKHNLFIKFTAKNKMRRLLNQQQEDFAAQYKDELTKRTDDLTAAQERVQELEALSVEEVARNLRDSGLRPDGFNELMRQVNDANRFWQERVRVLREALEQVRRAKNMRAVAFQNFVLRIARAALDATRDDAELKNA